MHERRLHENIIKASPCIYPRYKKLRNHLYYETQDCFFKTHYYCCYHYYPSNVVWNLYLAHHSGRVHPGSLIHGVAPYVKDWLSSPDHTAYERSAADAYSQVEVVERVYVHVFETMAHSHRVVHQPA